MANERELDIARKDGWMASAKGRRETVCPFFLSDLQKAWQAGFLAERDDREERRRNRGRKYIQRFNPSIKKWERYRKKDGKVVSRRKKRYACQESNW